MKMDNPQIMERARQWLGEGFDAQTKAEVQKMIDNNPKELEDSFYRILEFGTGGLRGIMGAGTNRMNIYTVALVTQGLASYVKDAFPKIKNPKAVISFDCRNNSRIFARRTAEVLAANGFCVYLFDDLRPTPELSFAIRHLHCQTGIMITASHNPREYNGYKAYWADGGQITAPHDTGIIARVEATSWDDILPYKEGGEGKIISVGKEIDQEYLNSILSLINYSPEAIAANKDMKIVYTPLHGCGVHLVPEALSRMGFTHIIHVPEQDVNDGNFPTVSSPNPEESSALAMAVAKAEENNAVLVMATDPDSDRVGIAVRNNKGSMQLLNGNQTASILIYYLLRCRKETGRLKPDDYIVKTIVTTDLLKVIADSYNVDCYNVLTGFKYIAEVVEEFQGKKTFIGGGEESYGFNVGEYVRDKDAVVSCALIAEVAAWAASQGMSLYDLLMQIYLRYGLFKESMKSLTLKGKDGVEKMKAMMEGFRSTPPVSLAGSRVVLIHDYLTRQTTDMLTDLRYDIQMPKSNVIQFICEDNTIVTVRPSGTEPKIKFYFGLHASLHSKDQFDAVNAQLEEHIQQLTQILIP